MLHYLPFAIPFLLLAAMHLWQWRWNKRHDQALKDLTQQRIDLQDWQR